MADEPPKPAIPAWQRAQQQRQHGQPTSDVGPASDTPSGAKGPATENQSDKPAVNPSAAPSAEEAYPPSTEQTLVQQMEVFLTDPSVKDAALDKKRAFLESKGIPKEIINQKLGEAASIISNSEFESFKRQQIESLRASQVTSQPNGPPIITYPEFLVEAHKPPPLVTLGRVVDAAYFAGGLAALLYGASKYLVNPMIDSLTEARHELATHSQSKIDMFNDRLAKIVSKVPEAKKEASLDFEINEVDSITSDPTELFHRDMGTQTSPLPSRRPSDPSIAADAPQRKDPTTYQSTGLGVLKDHMAELAEGLDKQEESNKERQESVNKLRHYLDTLLYASAGINLWAQNEDAGAMSKATASGGDDAIEELKKDIRSVKGVLLSARRFPAAAAASRMGA